MAGGVALLHRQVAEGGTQSIQVSGGPEARHGGSLRCSGCRPSAMIYLRSPGERPRWRMWNRAFRTSAPVHLRGGHIMEVPAEPESESADTPESAERGEHLTVVGVGASTGGLEAFTELLTHLPPATGMAFIFVQHLDAYHESALPELLSVKTRMPVLLVQGDTRVIPDHVRSEERRVG